MIQATSTILNESEYENGLQGKNGEYKILWG